MTWIKNKVLQLTKTYKTNDPFELAAAMNIKVYQWDLHSEIMGFYKYIRRNRFIFINVNLVDEDKKFTCSHELGHAVLHTKVNTPFLKVNTFYSIDKIEREANEFAVNLLLYDKNLKDYETKFDVLRETGIPYEMERFI
ncbi:ImmA/IrrE family metallo-endopeptidase [Caldifermentibacillus hisashii]|uniref:ImmA/IrrE family metallo-endopeptidase n=1 Tax=Caldifermentibacillus hisashii TaxID=996558 RepID=UPI0031010CD2